MQKQKDRKRGISIRRNKLERNKPKSLRKNRPLQIRPMKEKVRNNMRAEEKRKWKIPKVEKGMTLLERGVEGKRIWINK